MRARLLTLILAATVLPFGCRGPVAPDGCTEELDGACWTWVSGTSSINFGGVYGTQGTASPSNVPGARQFCFVDGRRWQPLALWWSQL